MSYRSLGKFGVKKFPQKPGVVKIKRTDFFTTNNYSSL